MDLVKDKVFTIVNTIAQSNHRNINETTHLFEELVLDSFGLIQLVGDLEAEFGVSLNTEDLTIQNFENVHTITKLVENYKSK